MQRLIIQPVAKEEINDAYRWYSMRSLLLSDQFLHEVGFCLDSIMHESLRFPKVRGEVRKAILHKFPYSVYFVIDEELEQIVVVACFHSRRDPRHWQNR
ncbi:MAG: type II toxin-antitoxin system RelE/ParE family toxin [Abditibacteriaceae bacterium]